MAKAQAQEPSMEEILASIRRIIADEDKDPPPAEAKAKAEEGGGESHVSEEDLDRLFASDSSLGGDEDEAEPADEDVLDLTEEAVVADDLDLVDGADDDLAFAEALTRPEPAPKPKAPEPVAPPPPPPVRAAEPRPMPVARASGDGLISQEAGMAVAAAFGSLSGLTAHRGGRTMEEVMEDLMRPMLKAWLDANLPPLVERLVRAEIERVSRGGV